MHLYVCPLSVSRIYIQRPDSEIARDCLRALSGLATFHAKAMQDVSLFVCMYVCMYVYIEKYRGGMVGTGRGSLSHREKVF